MKCRVSSQALLWPRTTWRPRFAVGTKSYINPVVAVRKVLKQIDHRVERVSLPDAA